MRYAKLIIFTVTGFVTLLITTFFISRLFYIKDPQNPLGNIYAYIGKPLIVSHAKSCGNILPTDGVGPCKCRGIKISSIWVHGKPQGISNPPYCIGQVLE